MMKTIAIASLAAVTLAAEPEASTGVVTAKFKGASGAMTLSAADSEITVRQAKLEEVNADGSKCTGKCTSINVAGGTAVWTPLSETKSEDGSVAMYSTTFSTSESGAEGGAEFSLTAHLAKTTSSTEETVECSACTSGSGSCQVDGACSAPTADGCSANATACTETVTVVENELKFSFQVKGFTFQNQDSKFSYGVTVTDKGGNTATTADSAGEKKLTMPSGEVVLPTTGTVKGPGADKTVDCTISTGESGQSTEINFLFPSWEAGETLYYDPTLSLAGTSGASAVGAGALLLGLPAMALLLQ